MTYPWEIQPKEMVGVRAYGNEPGVEIESRDGRLVIVAYAEGGFAATRVDLLDIIEWAKKNMPELLERQ